MNYNYYFSKGKNYLFSLKNKYIYFFYIKLFIQKIFIREARIISMQSLSLLFGKHPSIAKIHMQKMH